jgi:hypothetical protein
MHHYALRVPEPPPAPLACLLRLHALLVYCMRLRMRLLVYCMRYACVYLFTACVTHALLAYCMRYACKRMGAPPLLSSVRMRMRMRYACVYACACANAWEPPRCSPVPCSLNGLRMRKRMRMRMRMRKRMGAPPLLSSVH